MIMYLLKSAICLTVLLAVYHLLLERKKMHRFNRFYLLLSLVAGLALPALSIKISVDALNDAPLLSKAITVQQAHLQVQPETITETTAINVAPSSYSPETLLLLFYAFITGILAVRFAGNLLKIRSQINKHPKLNLEKASLVLLAKDVDPYSFLNYVFLNENDYRNGRIEGQLLEHELTHVRQMHSLDIIVIEVLKILFWFNPVFIFYKKAIQLNHEFLADEAVVNTYEVYDYQYLLLERSVITNPYPLTSNLHFSLTKKRLTMMTKTTSKLKIWTARLAVVPVVAVLMLLFSMRTVTNLPELKPTVLKSPATTVDAPKTEAFFKGATIWIENNAGKYMPKKYDEMTAAEKAALPAPPKILAKVPTKEMMSSWKTKTDTYTICINDKWVENTKLAKYKAADIAYYSIRKPGNVDLLVNKNYGRAPRLVDMYTVDRHATRFVAPYNKPGKWLGVYQNKIWPGPFDGAELIRQYFKLEELKKTDPNAGKRSVVPPFKPEPIL